MVYSLSIPLHMQAATIGPTRGSTSVWSDSIAIGCWQTLVKIADRIQLRILSTTLVFSYKSTSCANGVHCTAVCMCGDVSK